MIVRRQKERAETRKKAIEHLDSEVLIEVVAARSHTVS